jgi:hypothetical protein
MRSQHICCAVQIADKMGEHAPWVLKDPRLCLSSPLWLSVLKDPMCIIIYKNPREVGGQCSAVAGRQPRQAGRQAGRQASQQHVLPWGVLLVLGMCRDLVASWRCTVDVVYAARLQQATHHPHTSC